MLKFQKIRYKNFLSSGNYWTEIELDKHESTLIIGKNGAGKSTFLDALTFSLFNKPFRKINKNQLINSMNEKDCLVEVEFSIDTTFWKVVRGIKPSIFKIYKDNKVLDQEASSIDQQKWLEQSILKLNYKSFIQIVVLGATNFVPFMQLSSQNRREVVEDLLDIKLFSAMNDIAKNNIKLLRDEVKEIQYKKQNISDKIEMQSKFISELEKRAEEDINEKEEKINLVESNVKKLISVNDKINLKVKEKAKESEKISSSQEKLKKLDSIKYKLQQKISSIDEEKTFFEKNLVCPTCTQSIKDEFRLNKIEETSIKLGEIESACKELQLTINQEQDNEINFLKITKEITQLNNEVNSNNIKISELERQGRDLQQEIQKLTNRNKDVNFEYEKLNELKASLNEIVGSISVKKEELLNYEFVHLLLKDDGAKTKIIKKYLPLINKNLNKYLEIFEFPVNFTLDQEFNEKALSPVYEDFSYSSFSEGEKMRIDLSLLFTWREIAKVKNSINTNLLILDEIFDSSLDDFGTDNFIRIIKHVISKSNVFVISHKTDELVDKFENIVKFSKIKGFSMMD
jgi:DNA repair exonuclease SbcCD ATPase subunit